MRLPHWAPRPLVAILLICMLAVPLQADRTRLKPGWNLFSPEQDVEMGREVAAQADRQLQIINDRQTAAYINALGKQLAAKAPGERFPYQFKVVNDKAINAFALPGGFIYIHRGTIEAARNEAQLASVVAHEIAHVALRHGTNQVSKAYVTQAPLQILGGLIGAESVGGVLAQLGISFAASSILLNYSRDAERQADLMGAQILYDSGYDPNAMIQFFERIQAESRGRAVEFFSSHPNPENRIIKVKEEIERLGGSPPHARTDSASFQSFKSSLTGMAPTNRGRDAVNRRPARPSDRYVRADFRGMTLSHPNNWREYGQGGVVTLAPDGGIVSGALAYGMLIAVADPDPPDATIDQATDRLLRQLRRSNPKMRIAGGRERIRVGRAIGLATRLANESPLGSRETDWLVTVFDPEGRLVYFVGVAPENEFSRYRQAFDRVISSVRFY